MSLLSLDPPHSSFPPTSFHPPASSFLDSFQVLDQNSRRFLTASNSQTSSLLQLSGPRPSAVSKVCLFRPSAEKGSLLRGARGKRRFDYTLGPDVWDFGILDSAFLILGPDVWDFSILDSAFLILGPDIWDFSILDGAFLILGPDVWDISILDVAFLILVPDISDFRRRFSHARTV
jgi:hypothetical protein